MVCYLRCVLKELFFKGKKSKHILISEPRDLRFEKFCLQKYSEILHAIKSELESKTGLEQDIEKYEGADVPYREKMALRFRIARKKLIRNQISIIKWLTQIISESTELAKMKSYGETEMAINQEFIKMYMEPMDFENQFIVKYKDSAYNYS